MTDDLPAVVTVPVLMPLTAVAGVLGCSTRTVRRRIDQRLLPAVDEGGRLMVRGDDLRAYIDKLERPGPKPARRRSSAPRSYEFLR